MAEQRYPYVINKLLRRYLKFKRMPEFDRLAAYADLWQVNDDATFAIRALRSIRLGQKEIDLNQLNRISNEKKRGELHKHITCFITKGTEESETEKHPSKGAVSIGLSNIPFSIKSRAHFRQLMDSTIEVS